MAGPMKKVADSYTEQVQVLTQGSLNGYNRLFGGQLMEWIDIVAAVVARRHSGCNVTTAFIDSLDFKAAAYANDTLVLQGKIVYVGRTSMEVCVRTFVEELTGIRRLINRAYIILVALDENEKPTPVPGLILETELEKEEWKTAEERRMLRKKKNDINTSDGKEEKK